MAIAGDIAALVVLLGIVAYVIIFADGGPKNDGRKR